MSHEIQKLITLVKMNKSKSVQDVVDSFKKDGLTVRKERTGTKMEAALETMTKNPNMVRKQIIAKFISDVGLTKAGANTYYSLCQKKLKK